MYARQCVSHQHHRRSLVLPVCWLLLHNYQRVSIRNNDKNNNSHVRSWVSETIIICGRMVRWLFGRPSGIIIATGIVHNANKIPFAQKEADEGEAAAISQPSYNAN